MWLQGADLQQEQPLQDGANLGRDQGGHRHLGRSPERYERNKSGGGGWQNASRLKSKRKKRLSANPSS